MPDAATEPAAEPAPASPAAQAPVASGDAPAHQAAPTPSPAPAPTTAPTAAPTSAPDRAGRAKAWGEGLSALLKAALLALSVIAVAAFVVSTVWRELRTRHLDVVIDPATETALRERGSELDLRQAFVDALNDRLRGAQEVIELQGRLVDTRDAESISLKPFGLDTTTDQLAVLVRRALDTAPPPKVRVELICTPLPCAQGSTGGASLLVTLSDASASQRVVYPLGTALPGLRRGLRAAMRQAAERLLEQLSPAAASVHFLNVPMQHGFADEWSRDLQRAAGLALRLRESDGRVSCLGNLVLGVSLARRGNWDDGIALEQRAADEGDVICQIHAVTNVMLLMTGQICNADASQRQQALALARKADERLAGLDSPRLTDVVRDRIPAAKFGLDLMALLQQPDHEATRQAYCSYAHVTPATQAATTEHEIVVMAKGLSSKLPPRESQKAAHGALAALVMLQESGIAPDATAARYGTALALTRAIEAYLPTDTHPRVPLVLRGRLALTMAAASLRTMALAPGPKLAALKAAGVEADSAADADRLLLQEWAQRVTQARLDFDTALAATALPPLVEPSPDVEVWTGLGDAQLAGGDVDAAREAYARGIDAYIDADAPVDQVFLLAQAVARLGALQMASGACRANDAEAAAEARWRRRGFTLKALCAGAPASGGTSTGLLKIVQPLAMPKAARCGALPLPPMATARYTRPHESAAMLECLREFGPDEQRAVRDFQSQHRGTELAAEIEQALDAVAP